MRTKQNNLCVVTGGCGPLGWTIAKQLSMTGLHILAVDLPKAVEQRRLEAANSGISFLPLDLSLSESADAVQGAVDATGRSLQALINNAAFTSDSSIDGFTCEFEEQSDEAFDAALTLNLAVPFRLVRRLAPTLKKTEGSAVVNIASIYGLVGPDLRLYVGTSMGNPAGYAASKGGLVQLSRYLATVLAPQVRVNCIAPGGLNRGQDSTFVKRYEARTPLQRMGKEQEVADAVEWLIGDKSTYVTGQVLAVDGGWTAW